MDPIQTRGRTLPLAARFYDAMMTILTLGREKRFRTRALDLAQLSAGERVLDVGCGTGTLALLARERVGRSGQVCGIDATPKMIDLARHKAMKRKLDVQFDTGLIEDLPFPDGTFDVVLSTLMMHHLPPDLQQQGLSEIERVLRPGGRLLIVDFGARGHGLGSLIYHRESWRIGHGLVQSVNAAGFVEVESGRAGPVGIIYVRGHKPEPGAD